ncbi:ATP-dependent zinc metalloprotease FtsH [Parabacteroides sp. FAFU027]|uniref:ATP-dependent zinc metalloprotease FtsH n=1 Tax=Parabacteroides sp. FAFU027 TaxID=2922715 RepID=UPI001FAEEF8A|nr:ATP-dependent zinc metalloprotease FtsH [Parabacteroides sp. FAFU027]
MEQPQNPNNKKPNFKINLYWIYTVIAFILIGGYYYSNMQNTTDVSWSKFQKYAKDGSIKNIVVYQGQNMLEATVQDSAIQKVTGKTKQEVGSNPKITVQIPSSDKISDLVSQWEKENGVSVPLKYEKGNDFFSQFLWTFGPLILLAFVWIYFMRRMSGQGGAGGGVFNVGKAKAQIFDKSAQNKVTFKDVAGLSEAKQEVEEIVEFLRNPSKFTELGGKIPKGALLIGPPGTGKTLLAKAVAGEADVPFFSLSGSDFVEMFVGVGASRVRDLFRQAKEKAPCIIFIDEIDAVGRARGKNPSMGGNDERESTLNQLLTEMDGFGTNSGIIVMAATNRVDILDKALLRAGRFDRQINVDLPDLNDRKEIFGVHLRPIKIDESVNIEFLSRQTPGFSGADIANVCNEAALIAARNGKTYVQKQDFMDAVDRIIGGLEKKTKITTREEREAISIHESGHATLSWFLEHASPLVKVTIVPRGRALGAAWYLPEERQITTKEQMLDEMCATLGGRAAEEIFLGRISTGAINDLERVNKQAYAMIAYYGMSDKLSNICYYDSTGQEYGFTKPYSESTALLIDQEVNKMINEQYDRAKEMLLAHKDGHRALTDKLLETEVIYKEDLEKIFGERLWKSRSEEVLANVEPKADEPKDESSENDEINQDVQPL